MIGILYILLTIPAGYFILRFTGLLERFREMRCDAILHDRGPQAAQWMFTLPASYLIGTLTLTWVAYIVSYILKSFPKPLIAGNIASFLLSAIIICVGLIRMLSSKTTGMTIPIKSRLFSGLSKYSMELAYSIAVLAISSYMIIHSFRISGGEILVGYSVYSDFGPHMAMIRSFSLGSNFPTEYPHFADGQIRYHFMFQFLAGNLEFLGLRLDWAFNLPSILSMLSFLMLLFYFAVSVTSRKWTGCLTGIMFMFRSSFAFFTYVFKQDDTTGIFTKLLSNATHIGETPYEEWGLWAQKTFINQRHFAFGFGIILVVIILVYPLLIKALSGHSGSISASMFARRDSWWPDRYSRPVALGLILGLAVFWNGAVVIAALSILFIMAFLSRHKVEYLIIAVITVSLAFAGTLFFFGTASGALETGIQWGFIAPDKSFSGIAAYFTELLGLFPFVLAAALIAAPKGRVHLAIALFAPILIAMLLKLTPDIVVNHKYILIAVILLNIFVADLVVRLFSIRRTALPATVACIIVFGLTVTGFADFITLNNIDRNAFHINTKDPAKEWIVSNTRPNDIFLTEQYVTHPVLMAGRKLFAGWPYYAWSAGYDTEERERTVKEIYGAETSDELTNLVSANEISYIVIDERVRQSSDYRLNEELIRNTYGLAYADETEKLAIYATNLEANDE